MSTVLLVGLTAGLAILSLWSPEDMHDLLARPAVRFGLVGLSVVLSAYSVEKEVSLRRVSRRRAAGAACRTDRCGAQPDEPAAPVPSPRSGAYTTSVRSS